MRMGPKMYKTKDTERVLPENLHNSAIEYAKEKTGLERPVREQQVYINTFRDCFKIMKALGMLKKEYQDGPKQKED